MDNAKKAKKQYSNIKEKYPDSKKYNKHFTYEDRLWIEKVISDNRDPQTGAMTIMLKDIGGMMENDPSTISKEVKLHRFFHKRNTYMDFKLINSLCKNFEECTKKTNCIYKNSLDKLRMPCINECSDFEELICPYLKKFPWVCNGCPNVKKCRLNKYFYHAKFAQDNYEKKLVESRTGINLTPEQFMTLDNIVSPAVTDKKQPIMHIYKANEKDIPVSVRTVYNYVKLGFLSAKPIDLRRAVKYKPRYKSKQSKAVFRQIKIGRTYEDYTKYMNENHNVSVVEMDTVESANKSAYLLTLHFINSNLQLAYILPTKEAAGVVAVFDDLEEKLGTEAFKQIFQVILTDNGTEFSNPKGIETNSNTGEIRSKVFFCHPYSSFEKGACEKNHEFIRYFFPKKFDFKDYTQNQIDLMMSHINSTIRDKFKSCPIDIFTSINGKDILDKLNIHKIEPNEVILDKKVLDEIK